MSERKIGDAYFHINNGGVEISVVDGGNGPTLKISASHFGHKTNGMELMVSPGHLLQLGEMLVAASKESFSPPYCVQPQLSSESERLARAVVAGQAIVQT